MNCNLDIKPTWKSTLFGAIGLALGGWIFAFLGILAGCRFTERR